MSRYYTLQQIADQMSLSYTTIWREVKDGKLKATPVRGNLRVAEEDLDSYLKQQRDQEEPRV